MLEEISLSIFIPLLLKLYIYTHSSNSESLVAVLCSAAVVFTTAKPGLEYYKAFMGNIGVENWKALLLFLVKNLHGVRLEEAIRKVYLIFSLIIKFL